MEILAAFAFLSISYKSTSLLYRSRHHILHITLISLIVYSSSSFVLGDSAEEFCLPLIAYALYIGLRAIVNKRPISPLQAFFIGVTAAAVLWIKYTMCGFYLGWIISLIYIYRKNKWQAKILSTFAFAAIGLATLTILIFAYFIYHDSLDTMLNVYFFNNAKYYSHTGDTSISNILNNISGNWDNNLFIWIFTIAGILLARPTRLSAFFLSSATTLVIFIFLRMAMPYYVFIVAVFIPFGIVLIESLLHQTKSLFSYSIISLISLNIIYNIVSGTYIFMPKGNTVQYKFDQIIQQESNPTLLNYGFLDGGFYTYSGIVPSNRFFCRLNIPIPEMMREQDSIIANQHVEFIVTRTIPDLPKYNFEYEFNGYQKVAEERQLLEIGLDAIYTLHKRITADEISE